MKVLGTVAVCVAVVLYSARAAPSPDSPPSRSLFSKLGVSIINLECNDEYSLVVEHDSIGIHLSILTTGQNKNYSTSENDELVSLLSLTGQRAPSDVQCGQDNFRCKNQLIVKNNSLNRNSSVIFVPLNKALLLVMFVTNDTHLTLQDYHLINLTSYNCSPIDSMKIASSIYTVCVNLETERSYISLFEIRLSREVLSQSYAVGPLAQNYYETSANLHLSDFKYVHLYRFHFIYFAISNYLYYFEPLNYDLDYLGELPSNCTFVQELDYIGDDILLVHCNNEGVVYFNLAYQHWTQYQLYSEYGRPYTCQENDTSHQEIVLSESGHIELRNFEIPRNHNIELVGENFLSGECFGRSSGFYFVYMDKNEGTFVLNLNTFNFTQLSMQACNNSITNSECKPIQVLDNRYLVLQQPEGTPKVLDSKHNFKRIGSLTNTNKSLNFLVTIIDTNTLDQCSLNYEATTTPALHTTTTNIINATTVFETKTIVSTMRNETDTTDPRVQHSTQLTVGLVIGASTLIMVLVVATVLIIIVFTCTLCKSETANTRYHITDTEKTNSISLTTANKVPYMHDTDLTLEKHLISIEPLENEKKENSKAPSLPPSGCFYQETIVS